MPESRHFNPPIDRGLSGNRYLSEDLETHVSDLSDAHTPGIYALRLSKPPTLEAVRDRWHRHYEADPPDYIAHAYECNPVLYVGAAKNIHQRITEHLESPNRSSAITRVFPIFRVFQLWPTDSADEAFTRESGVAIDLSNAYPSAYVHQR